MNKQTSPVRYFSHPSPTKTSSDCLSHKRLASRCPVQMSFERTHEVFNVWTKIVATCVVEDVSLYLGTVTLKIKKNSWNSPNLHCLAVFPTWQYCLYSLVWWIYMKSIDSGVCHRLWSTLLWNVRAYLLTIKYQVVQFLPNISISEQFESMHLTILQQILFLLLWSGGHRCRE